MSGVDVRVIHMGGQTPARVGFKLGITGLELTHTTCSGCGPEGIRTPGLVSAIHALSQLSYGPT